MISFNIKLWRKGRKALRQLLTNLGGRESMPLAIVSKESVHAPKKNTNFKFWSLTNKKSQCSLRKQQHSRQEKASRTQCKSFFVVSTVQEIYCQSLFPAFALLQAAVLRISEGNTRDVRFVIYFWVRKTLKLHNSVKSIYKAFNLLPYRGLRSPFQIALDLISNIDRFLSINIRLGYFFFLAFLVSLKSSRYPLGVPAVRRKH